MRGFDELTHGKHCVWCLEESSVIESIREARRGLWPWQASQSRESSTEGTSLWEAGCGEVRSGEGSYHQPKGGPLCWRGFHLLCSRDPSAKCLNNSPLTELHFEGQSSAATMVKEPARMVRPKRPRWLLPCFIHDAKMFFLKSVNIFSFLLALTPFFPPFPWNSYGYWAAGPWSK